MLGNTLEGECGLVSWGLRVRDKCITPTYIQTYTHPEIAFQMLSCNESQLANEYEHFYES